MRRLYAPAVFAAAAFAAAPALAWDVYSYPDAKFAVQFPAQPQIGPGRYRTAAGLDAPTEVYLARDGAVAYSLTLVDFTGTALDKDAAIADAVQVYGKTGQVLVNVEARINAEYGRELSIDAKDGSRSVVAIFFFDQHLYVLDGRAAPPEPVAQTANLIRFQQSLNFLR
jgi:hypothetical protein